MILDPVLDIIRSQAAKKWASKVPTSLRSLSQVKSVAILMDVEAWGFQESKEEISSWFRSQGLRPDMHFFDFRKLEKDELLLTSITNTILKKDLNWFGMPDPSHIVDVNEDLFISLVDNADFPVRFFSTTCRSPFKVGCHGWEGHPFDLLVSAQPGATTMDLFNEMKKYLLKLK
ncbi:MAG: hypothetical protein MJZ07_07840 [Bacteroidales bacterium]|nr:hypothetical protein [Bacteroidales bacterium]